MGAVVESWLCASERDEWLNEVLVFLRSCLGQDWVHEGSRFICSIKKGENSGTDRRKMLHNKYPVRLNAWIAHRVVS